MDVFEVRMTRRQMQLLHAALQAARTRAMPALDHFEMDFLRAATDVDNEKQKLRSLPTPYTNGWAL